MSKFQCRKVGTLTLVDIAQRMKTASEKIRRPLFAVVCHLRVSEMVIIGSDSNQIRIPSSVDRWPLRVDPVFSIGGTGAGEAGSMEGTIEGTDPAAGAQPPVLQPVAEQVLQFPSTISYPQRRRACSAWRRTERSQSPRAQVRAATISGLQQQLARI